jgi:hypothetical protein
LKRSILFAAALLIVASGPASAATLDFSDPQWDVGDGYTSHTFDTELGQVTISSLTTSGSSTSDGLLGASGEGWWSQPDAFGFGEVLQLEFHDGIHLTEATFSQVAVWEAGVADTDETKVIFWGGGLMQTVAFDEQVSYIRISSTWWNFNLYSLTATSLPSSGVAPIPEPEAALLFPIGALIVGYAIRRQRSAASA